MGSRYNQLSDAERIAIMVMGHGGHGVRAIAGRLGRSPATISREMRRQPYWGKLPYEATRAGAYAFYNRWQGRNRCKLKPGNRLFGFVARQLRRGWSPQQIAGRLAAMHPDEPEKRVCHETIYRALYALPRGELRRELLACLRQGHKTRWPRSRGASRRDSLPEDLRIAARPEEIAERLIPGHWEGDLIKGAFNRTAVGTLVERSSRLVMLVRLTGFDSLTVQKGFERMFANVPKELRKSLTYDRGSEMARHRDLTANTGIRVYFADPYCPWQRGSNENANGLIRQYLPKGSDLSRHTQADLNRIADLLNTRPRKVLAFRTPIEVFEELMRDGLRTGTTKRTSAPSPGSTEERPSPRPDLASPQQRAQRTSGSAARDRAKRRRRRP